MTQQHLAQQQQPAARFLTTAEFMAGFKLPSYVLDGILLRGNLYSMTGKSGHGKSAVGLSLAFIKAMNCGELNGKIAGAWQHLYRRRMPAGS